MVLPKINKLVKLVTGIHQTPTPSGNDQRQDLSQRNLASTHFSIFFLDLTKLVKNSKANIKSENYFS